MFHKHVLSCQFYYSVICHTFRGRLVNDTSKIAVCDSGASVSEEADLGSRAGLYLLVARVPGVRGQLQLAQVGTSSGKSMFLLFIGNMYPY